MPDTAARILEAFIMPFDSMEPSIATGAEVIADEDTTTHTLPSGGRSSSSPFPATRDGSSSAS